MVSDHFPGKTTFIETPHFASGITAVGGLTDHLIQIWAGNSHKGTKKDVDKLSQVREAWHGWLWLKRGVPILGGSLQLVNGFITFPNSF